MEANFHDEEWESLSKMFSLGDSDFLMHFNGNGMFPSSNVEIPPNCTHESINFPNDSNFYSISQESSNNSEVESAHFLNSENHHPNGVNFLEANTFESMQYNNMDCINNNNNNNLMMPFFSDDMMEEILQLKAAIDQPAETGDSMQLKRKPDEDLSETPKKRTRVSKTTQKNKRVVQPKKKKKIIEENSNNGEEEITNNEGNKQSSSMISSSDDDSQDIINGGSTFLNSNGKARATRGSATDPQSLYARRRREKINERLKILQNLVPNGTKVDISTMLEEAVHYVKFLQLQIKLLSSDEMWMYAPIAYNGMDMGLYQKISQNLWP